MFETSDSRNVPMLSIINSRVRWVCLMAGIVTAAFGCAGSGPAAAEDMPTESPLTASQHDEPSSPLAHTDYDVSGSDANEGEGAAPIGVQPMGCAITYLGCAQECNGAPPRRRCLDLPRYGGHSNYAAISFTLLFIKFNSYSMGLT